MARPFRVLKMDARAWSVPFLWLYRTRAGRDLLHLIFLLAVLMVVVRSVEDARWVPMPSLTLTVLLAVFASYLVARTPRRSAWAHLAANTAGVIVVYLLVIPLVDATSWMGRFPTMHTRMVEWWGAVVGKDASTDLLPVAVMLTAFTWLTGYLSAWVILKRRTIWLVVVPTGLGLIANLTWLPSNFLIYLFAYVAAVMLLAAHSQIMRREESRARVSGEPSGRAYLAGLAHALWTGALILTVAIALPALGWTNSTINDINNSIHRRVESLKTEFIRAFSIPAKTPSSLRFFGSVLPLQRQIPQGEDPIFIAEQSIPSYWPIKAYSEYTSTAWKLENTQFSETKSIEIQDNAFTALLLDTEDIENPELDEFISFDTPNVTTVDVLVDTPYFFVPHNVSGLDRRGRAEVHDDKEYRINFLQQEENQDLAPNLRQWADLLTGSDNPQETLKASAIALPSYLTITRVTLERPQGKKETVAFGTTPEVDLDSVIQEIQGGAKLLSVDVQRVIPSESDTLSVRPEGWLRAGSTYRFQADPVTPTEGVLRTVDLAYPVWVKELYLGLPEKLPERVGELALDLTKDSNTSYDKAVAIEDYLRTYQYQTSHPNIEFDADAVDQFLFNTKAGPSDYFASAMAVMLRTLGIPSRLVLGYAPGEYNERINTFMVRDKDSHSWPEVYFPSLGWVEFEPSPIYNKRPRGVLEDSGEGSFPTGQSPSQTSSSSGSPDEIPTQEEESASAGGEEPSDESEPLGGEVDPSLNPLLEFGTPLGRDGAIFLATLGFLSVVTWLVWRRMLLVLNKAEASYLQLQRLSSFLGIKASPSQTPSEFGRMLSTIVPKVRHEVASICTAFVKHTYGRETFSALERLRLLRAWRNVRNGLLKELLREKKGIPSA